MRSLPSGDTAFKVGAALLASSVVLIVFLAGYVLVSGSTLVLSKFGTYFFTGIEWNSAEGHEIYGALPYLLGTLATSGIAIVVGVPISLGIAIFLSEMSPRRLRIPVSNLVELLAAVPSVIYGLWGFFVFRYFLADYIETPLSAYLGWLPGLGGSPVGVDVLSAGLILSIMIIPTVSSVSREVISAVPNSIREGAYSIGATRWEVTRHWVLNYARSGLFGAVILGLGRAVGETIAVSMVIGNAVGPLALPTSLLKQSQTMSSYIVNIFFDATPGTYEFSAILGVGLFLLVLALVINVLARLMVTRLLKVKGGAVE
ncbi:MAG: phosphate ABC transporter permease subunit PstC [archaeon]|nr:MAG: phosphate ABC transporter permease subunit PstC [archaeon]